MKTAFLFPGQGAQYVGMGKDLYNSFSSVKNLFEECSTYAHKNLAQLLFESDEAKLMETENTQIAMMLVSLAATKVLEEKGIRANMVAGFSLGEYAALVVAKVVSLEDACKLVILRGKIMEECSKSLMKTYSKEGTPGMTAVLGLHPHIIEKHLKEYNIPNVHVAMHNSPIQAVLAGTETAREQAVEKLQQLDIPEGKVKRAIPLKVSGPFHTPLMNEARLAFDEQSVQIQFDDPQIPMFSNVTGKSVVRGADVRSLCLEQIVCPVVWVSEEKNIEAMHPKRVLEVGAGNVLCGLWKAWKKTQANADAIVDCVPAGTIESIDNIQ